MDWVVRVICIYNETHEKENKISGQAFVKLLFSKYLQAKLLGADCWFERANSFVSYGGHLDKYEKYVEGN